MHFELELADKPIEIVEFESGLNILYGPQEAGKKHRLAETTARADVKAPDVIANSEAAVQGKRASDRAPPSVQSHESTCCSHTMK